MADDSPKPVGDEYTAQYMEGGRARIVTKQRMPWWFFAVIGFAAMATMASAFATGPVNLIGLIPLVLITLVLSHLRVVVTDDALHVQYGLWGPTIAVENITRCEVTTAPLYGDSDCPAKPPTAPSKAYVKMRPEV